MNYAIVLLAVNSYQKLPLFNKNLIDVVFLKWATPHFYIDGNRGYKKKQSRLIEIALKELTKQQNYSAAFVSSVVAAGAAVSVVATATGASATFLTTG